MSSDDVTQNSLSSVASNLRVVAQKPGIRKWPTTILLFHQNVFLVRLIIEIWTDAHWRGISHATTDMCMYNWIYQNR